MNKKNKDTIISIAVIAALIALILFVYNNQRNKGRRELANRIFDLSSKGGPPETIEGLKDAIALYEAQIEKNVKEGAQTGVYWKILAIRLADRGMHRNALDAIERALDYNTEDPTLFYLRAEYSSIIAASIGGYRENSVVEKEKLTSLAEVSYLRAIQLDASYPRPLLGLGILYTFDLERPQEAIPHLDRFIQLTTGNASSIEGMFVLARAYYLSRRYDDAVELYDRIVARSKDAATRSEALKNKDIIRNTFYE
jgi:tetratricopeptide (TPR) repeat protein